MDLTTMDRPELSILNEMCQPDHPAYSLAQDEEFWASQATIEVEDLGLDLPGFDGGPCPMRRFIELALKKWKVNPPDIAFRKKILDMCLYLAVSLGNKEIVPFLVESGGDHRRARFFSLNRSDLDTLRIQEYLINLEIIAKLPPPDKPGCKYVFAMGARFGQQCGAEQLPGSEYCRNCVRKCRAKKSP